MLKQIRLVNWKSFKDATLFIDPLTLIIGTNASGKSNALDALLFLQRVASGVAIFQAINGDTHLTGLRGGMEWVCRKPETSFTLELVFAGQEAAQEYRYELEIQVNGAKAEVSQEALTLLKYGPRGKAPKEIKLFDTQPLQANSVGLTGVFSTDAKGPGKRFELTRSQLVLVQAESLNLHKQVQEAIKWVSASLQMIFVFDPIPSHMCNYSAFAEVLQSDGSNIAGVLAALEPQRKGEVEASLTKFLKALPERNILKVWTEAVGRFQADAMLYCQEGWTLDSAHTVDARGMSDGSLRYLGIVTALLTRKAGSLLVIEEVDNGLHPSRVSLLLDMLRSLGKERKIDVLVTTHNPAILDAGGTQMVPFIFVAHRDVATGASLLTALEDLKGLPKLMAAGSLGDLVTSGEIEASFRAEAVP